MEIPHSRKPFSHFYSQLFQIFFQLFVVCLFFIVVAQLRHKISYHSLSDPFIHCGEVAAECKAANFAVAVNTPSNRSVAAKRILLLELLFSG